MITAHEIKEGVRVRVLIRCPFSEVCMHMRVAGKLMYAEIVDDDYPMVQLYALDGRMFSAPITTGEAGFYDRFEKKGKRATHFFYFYPPERWCERCERDVPGSGPPVITLYRLVGGDGDCRVEEVFFVCRGCLKKEKSDVVAG